MTYGSGGPNHRYFSLPTGISTPGSPPRMAGANSEASPPAVSLLASLILPSATRPNDALTHDSLREIFTGLSASERHHLETSWGRANLEELLSLGRETDRASLCEALLSLGRRLENDDKLETAGRIYSLILSASPGTAIGERAQQRLYAILGQGAVLPRLEFLGRRLVREASDPAAIIPMVAAGAMFRFARVATLSRLAASPTSNILTRGFGARILSGIAGFLLEAPTFTASTRGMNSLLEREQEWTFRAVGREFASGTLSLLGLKAMGGLSGLAVQRWGRSPTLGGGIARALLPQAGMFTGILLGHQLETRLGLREHQDGATTFTDAFAMLINFNVGGRLSHEFVGETWRSAEANLDRQAELLAQDNRRLPPGSAPSPFASEGGLVPALAASGEGSGRSVPLSDLVFREGEEAFPESLPTVSTQLRGEKNEEDSGRQAHFSDSAIRKFYPEERRVRRNGISLREDIEPALSYLSKLHPAFERLIRHVNEHDIPISLSGDLGQTHSYARISFNGLVDRTAPEHGKVISIARWSTPDVVLHEILHVLPLSVIREAFRELDFPVDSLEFPAVDPGASFADLRRAIFENIRLNETLSFGVECLVYELERQNGVTPIFQSDMMSNLDGAWLHGRLRGIRETFPAYLSHYESRLALITSLLACIVKVEGRNRIADEELEAMGVSDARGIKVPKVAEHLQNYLNRYVRANDLEVPEDFHSLRNILSRMQISFSEVPPEQLARILDATFQNLEHLKSGQAIVETPRLDPGRIVEVPASETQAQRLRLFSAYGAVVDRVLENPPGSLSREEIASLLSFARMSPPEAAQDLMQRMQIYLGSGLEDLRVAGGLLLMEKGYPETGREWIRQGLKSDSLPQLVPILKARLAPELFADLLQGEWEGLARENGRLGEFFSMAGQDRIMWEEPGMEAAAAELFRFPELFDARQWAETGSWLLEREEADSSSLPEAALMGLFSGQEKNYQQVRSRHRVYSRMLADLRNDAGLPEPLRREVDRQWSAILARDRAAYTALRGMMSVVKDTRPLTWVVERQDLDLYSSEELNEIFRAFPPKQRRTLVTLVEISNPHPWTYPEEVPRVADLLWKQLNGSAEDEAGRREAGLLEGRLLRLLDRSVGNRGLETALAPVLARLEGFRSEHYFGDLIHSDHSRLLDRYLWRSSTTLPDKLIEPEVHRIAYFNRLVRRLLMNPERRAEGLTEAVQALRAYRFSHIDEVESVTVYFGLYFLHLARESGHREQAEALFQFLFRDLPRADFSTIDAGTSDEEETTSQEVRAAVLNRRFFADQAAYEWTFRMDDARLEAAGEGHFESWFERIDQELERGGGAVTLWGLDYLARRFEADRDFPRLEVLYRLVVKRTVLDPNKETLRRAFTILQNSSLPEEARDRLLESLTRQLLDLVQGIGGMNLGLVNQLRHLVPWNLPFVRVEEIPHYARTEALLLERLDRVPELTEARHNKDDRARLAAFAAAGLPLQRYAEWMATQFSTSGTSLVLSRVRDSEIFGRLGLPTPRDIPSNLKREQALAFLNREGSRLESLLSETNENQVAPILRFLSRLLGSELRGLAENPNFRRVDSETTATGAWIRDWLGRQYRSTDPSPWRDRVQEILFISGPNRLNRFSWARELMGFAGNREERRRIFDQSAQHLVFSTRYQGRIRNVREGEEVEEQRLTELLMQIDYDRHPRRMISDFLLGTMERSPDLQRDYRDYLRNSQTENPLLLSEMGWSQEQNEVNVAEDWTQRSNEQRLEKIVNSLQFLKDYLELDQTLMWAGEGYLNFRDSVVVHNIERFPYLSNHLQESFSLLDGTSQRLDISHEISSFAEVLSVMGWGDRVAQVFDKIFNRPERREAILAPLQRRIDTSLESLRGDHRRMILQSLEDRMMDQGVPDFVAGRAGLERDLLLWTLHFLEPAQRVLLNQRLRSASSDRERLLLLGQAAHFEKILQGASVHPGVPEEYQRQFAVFQDQVPHRDAIDVQRTLEQELSPEVLSVLQVDMNRPINEGTIGGVYRATYEGEPVVLKIVPDGKRKSLEESFRILAGIRRYLQATEYAQPGARAVDDLLGFYERTLPAEMNLGLEPRQAEDLRAILPDGFQTPNFIEGLGGGLSVVGMNPLESRRLADLSPQERESLFHRVDRDLIPTMLRHGLFHYDLHPGNLGLGRDGQVILYDVGRVHRLTGEENVNFAAFFHAFLYGDWGRLPSLLRPLGTVRDEGAFSGIGELFRDHENPAQPYRAIQEIYPRLAEHGFSLSDSAVKLLLMFFSWEGTKDSLRRPSTPPQGAE